MGIHTLQHSSSGISSKSLVSGLHQWKRDNVISPPHTTVLRIHTLNPVTCLDTPSNGIIKICSLIRWSQALMCQGKQNVFVPCWPCGPRRRIKSRNVLQGAVAAKVLSAEQLGSMEKVSSLNRAKRCIHF